MKPRLPTALISATIGAILALVAFGLGCKGETTYKDRTETLDKLAATEKAVADKDALIKQLNARVTELQMDGGKVVVSMEGPRANGEPGPIIEIKGRGPNSRGNGGPADPKGNAKDTELYEAFVAKVKRSKGSIKKCYENALKKRSDLQTRSVTLTISVDYRTSGAVRGSRFSPKVTDEFDRCMAAVANKWKLPAMPKAVAFSYRQRLTPQ